MSTSSTTAFIVPVFILLFFEIYMMGVQSSLCRLKLSLPVYLKIVIIPHAKLICIDRGFMFHPLILILVNPT